MDTLNTPFKSIETSKTNNVTRISVKLHYTDTGYGRVVYNTINGVERTSSQQFYNLLYNKFATSQC